jgi:hypothetical protein
MPITFHVNVGLIPKPLITYSGTHLISNSVHGNTWYRDGQLIANVTNQVYTPIESGDYTVKVFSNGCSSEFSDPYTICICTSGISKNVQAEQFNVYPNPSQGNFTLKFSKAGNYDVKVINALGEQLWTGSLAEAENTIKLPGDLKGIFYMQVRSDEGAVMQKILIE